MADRRPNQRQARQSGRLLQRHVAPDGCRPSDAGGDGPWPCPLDKRAVRRPLAGGALGDRTAGPGKSPPTPIPQGQGIVAGYRPADVGLFRWVCRAADRLAAAGQLSASAGPARGGQYLPYEHRHGDDSLRMRHGSGVPDGGTAVPADREYAGYPGGLGDLAGAFL